ncbi:hypothetical protein L0F63_003332 [Massospora cicadina]|nr:hypothetical protein L0F63_003332 [Massospora cicadina]
MGAHAAASAAEPEPAFQALSQLPAFNPTCIKEKLYFEDRLIAHPTKRPKLLAKAPTPEVTTPKAELKVKPRKVVKSDGYVHAATCGFDFRPYADYVPTWRFPTASVKDLIRKAVEAREQNFVTILGPEVQTPKPAKQVGAIYPGFAHGAPLVAGEVASQDDGSSVITVTGVGRYMFEDVMGFFRSFGPLSTFEYAGAEPEALHIAYEAKEAAEAALAAQLPPTLSRFGVRVKAADPETSRRFLGVPYPPVPHPNLADLKPSKSVFETLKVLTDAHNFFLPWKS